MSDWIWPEPAEQNISLDFFLKICDFTLDGWESLARRTRLSYAECCRDPVGRATGGGVAALRCQPHGRVASRGTGENNPGVGGGPSEERDCRWTGDCPADRAFLGTAFSATRNRGVGGCAAVGATSPHWAGEDHSDRPQDAEGNAGRFHPLEHPDLSSTGASERLLGESDLAGPPVEAASGAHIQIEQ